MSFELDDDARRGCSRNCLNVDLEYYVTNIALAIEMLNSGIYSLLIV